MSCRGINDLFKWYNKEEYYNPRNLSPWKKCFILCGKCMFLMKDPVFVMKCSWFLLMIQNKLFEFQKPNFLSFVRSL
jgi:hypothetical protein